MKKTLLIISTFLLSIPVASWATLGESAPVPVKEQRLLKSNASTQPYFVQRTQTDSGVTVTEYARQDGTVFAVSWSGPVRPDMKQLLGQYFGRYLEASKPGGPPNIQQSDLILQTGGHMGDFFGKAYLPALVPDGVSANGLE